jgi:uncharacterized cupin superfamily protein
MSDQECFRFAVDAELEPWDFPAEDIIAGEPRTRGHSVTYTAPGGTEVFTGIFALDPCTIRAVVAATETIQVLEGEMDVSFDSGESFHAKAGDIVVFPAGTTTVREVKTPYKEFFVHAS